MEDTGDGWAIFSGIVALCSSTIFFLIFAQTFVAPTRFSNQKKQKFVKKFQKTEKITKNLENSKIVKSDLLTFLHRYEVVTHGLSTILVSYSL